MKLKMVFGALAFLALLASPAAAEAQYPSVAPKPPAALDDDQALRLKQCGAWWNRKLAAYAAQLPKQNQYLAYARQWENNPAQRPPKWPEPILTRETYRACMYECLGDRSATCPGGWPAETVETNE